MLIALAAFFVACEPTFQFEAACDVELDANVSDGGLEDEYGR